MEQVEKTQLYQSSLGGDGIESACTRLSSRVSEDLGDFYRAKVEAIGFIG